MTWESWLWVIQTGVPFTLLGTRLTLRRKLLRMSQTTTRASCGGSSGRTSTSQLFHHARSVALSSTVVCAPSVCRGRPWVVHSIRHRNPLRGLATSSTRRDGLDRFW